MFKVGWNSMFAIFIGVCVFSQTCPFHKMLIDFYSNQSAIQIQRADGQKLKFIFQNTSQNLFKRIQVPGCIVYSFQLYAMICMNDKISEGPGYMPRIIVPGQNALINMFYSLPNNQELVLHSALNFSILQKI